MSTAMIWQTVSTSSEDTERFGELFGKNLKGDLTIELRSDLGGGKTTFVKGLARGAGSTDMARSPTFTLNRVYKTPEFEIHHYDLYRLSEPGILADEIAESIADKNVVTVVEWGDVVKDVLPSKRLVIKLRAADEDKRQIDVNYPADYVQLIEAVRSEWQEHRP